MKKKIDQRNRRLYKILAVFFLIMGILTAVGGRLFSFGCSKYLSSFSVADYEKRVEIWDDPAGNSSRSKLEDMNIDYRNVMKHVFSFAGLMVGENYIDVEQVSDSFTYFYEIQTGFEKKTYEDKPYLIPYPVENSRGAVILIPGGAYAYKSTDGGGTAEGRDAALALNQAGYSAFVLHYRSNPYEYPIPMLDVQRAVRYLRFHAGEYGVDPNQIALLGFSAGGFQVGSYLNQIRGQWWFPEGYVPDEIDQVDDGVAAAGMIYPVLTFEHNVRMLFCLFDGDTVKDSEKREQLLQFTDLSTQFRSADVPQLVVYGTADNLAKMDGAQKYIAAARLQWADIQEVAAEGQGHAFGMQYYMNDYVQMLERVLHGN